MYLFNLFFGTHQSLFKGKGLGVDNRLSTWIQTFIFQTSKKRILIITIKKITVHSTIQIPIAIDKVIIGTIEFA